MIVIGPDFRIPPDLGPLQVAFLLLWFEALRRYEAQFPGATITLTSWYRDAMRNAQVGGVLGSLHQVGLAGDSTVDRSIVRSALCGVGSLVGLCAAPGPFSFSNSFRSLAPPYTQALQEANGSFHFELDLSGGA